jgi:hypothetical protein
MTISTTNASESKVISLVAFFLYNCETHAAAAKKNLDINRPLTVVHKKKIK